MKKLVLTLSGGMDSSVLLYMAQDRGYDEIHTITFDYGQRHTRELACVDKQIDNFNKQFNGWFNLKVTNKVLDVKYICLLYTSPSPRDRQKSRMPSSA